MSEQIENQVILDAVQDTPEAVETVSPQGEDDGEDQGEQGAEEQRKPKVNGVQKRINKFVKTLAEQGEENRRLKAELESLRQSQGNQQPKDEKPNHQHYNDINAYEKDLIDWNTRQINSQRNAEPSRNRVDYAEEQRVSTWKSRVDELAKANPRINEITSDELYFIDAFPAIGQVVKESVNPELVLHLVDNPQLIEDLHDLSPIQVARELGKIEASLKKPVLRKQSNAVAPITPVKGNGAVARVDVNNLSMEDYYKNHLKRLSGS